MVTNSFKRLLLLVPVTALLLFMAQSAFACTCGPEPTLLESLEHSDEVVILRIVSVEKVENTPNRHYVHGVKSTTMVVEKVFKGDLKAGEQITFVQGGGGDCISTFNEQWVGHQYLFYLTRPEKLAKDSLLATWKDPSLWVDYTCGRSRSIEGAAADLLYLENVSKVKGKTRISGRLDARQNSGLDFAGQTVKITGSKKVYETKTNKNGVFEIYDLPPGKYAVETEIPSGWKIDLSWLAYSMRGTPNEEYLRRRAEWEKRIEITLEPKKHATVDFVFEPDNSVRGRVLGPKGIPIPRVRVDLLRPGADDGPSGYTDEQGRFEIKSIPTGDYVLVANKEGKLSTQQPFRKIFHPNVWERERAAVVSIAPGETVEDVDIVIPHLEETITIEGVARYSDGKPVADRWINFNATKTDKKVDGNVYAKTDREGRFTLTVLKGLKGELLTDVYLIAGYYKNCPKVDELIAKSGAKSVRVYSNKIELTTEENLFQVELTLPFPLCEKAKQ